MQLMVVFYLLDIKYLHFSEITMISSFMPDKLINLMNLQQITMAQSINKLLKKINDYSFELVCFMFNDCFYDSEKINKNFKLNNKD